MFTDAAGLVVNSHDYDSYGSIEASVEGIANPFAYSCAAKLSSDWGPPLRCSLPASDFPRSGVSSQNG